uniref:Uncharacterized protein n=1 Tax=Arundo donax TaxID=35708 RepID=A0A0A8ZB70_ARUDO
MCSSSSFFPKALSLHSYKEGPKLETFVLLAFYAHASLSSLALPLYCFLHCPSRST